jgi:hypothetical protein
MDTESSYLAAGFLLKSAPLLIKSSAKSASFVGPRPSFKGMRIVEVSQNAKTGPISTTYMSQYTCPSNCPHLGSNCYAEKGLVGMHTRRIAREADEQMDEMRAIHKGKLNDDLFRGVVKDYPELMVSSEASAIRNYLTGKHKLRVHVVGDVVTMANANELGSAMKYHTSKHGKAAWTYTHRWRDIPAISWNGASVWASVEKAKDVAAARLMGYASALCLPSHPTHKRYEYEGLTVVPCPAQKLPRKVTCSTCNICAESAKMFQSGHVLGFAAE